MSPSLSGLVCLVPMWSSQGACAVPTIAPNLSWFAYPYLVHIWNPPCPYLASIWSLSGPKLFCLVTTLSLHSLYLALMLSLHVISGPVLPGHYLVAT